MRRIFLAEVELKHRWKSDQHIRDVITSALLPCKFREAPCVALDLGANIGSGTLSMLRLNTIVTAVEPQPDLCASRNCGDHVSWNVFESVEDVSGV